MAGGSIARFLTHATWGHRTAFTLDATPLPAEEKARRKRPSPRWKAKQADQLTKLGSVGDY
jgi:hypothetical protein